MFGDCIENPIVPQFHIRNDALGLFDITHRGVWEVNIWIPTQNPTQPHSVVEKMSRLCVVGMGGPGG
ncbi:hypothetical protein M378DRAFT_173738 [Amanita muscaria Koide BX008]|uniref:Uncharacterized protein n=1 Tax=Amanita muscaria (strain Koide BX008) TaxID=946122 RepID=A0A0C2RY86_AMAMK|nr:hypothetical protein M378DRAFT_173738 [Amanita muscaria Koide BX008]